MLGLDAESKTTQNILRTGECVLNLPDESMAGYVNKLADATGSNPVSQSKLSRNYSYVKDKWARSGLSPSKSDLVSPDCVAECPVQVNSWTPLFPFLAHLKSRLSLAVPF